MIEIKCKNDGLSHQEECGISLAALSAKICTEVRDAKSGRMLPVIAAIVDNRLKSLDFRLTMPHQVEFIGYNHAGGRRCYSRSLCFVLQKAVRDLFPDKILVIDHSIPSGLYCELRERRVLDNGRRQVYPVSESDIAALKMRMESIVEADLPFGKTKMLSEDAITLFEEQNQPNKAELLRSLGTFNCSIYSLGDCHDSFHGPLVALTGVLSVFDLNLFSSGFCLQLPELNDFTKVVPMKPQTKIAAVLEEYSEWCDNIGISGVGSLNKAIRDGQGVKLINIAEALHERKYAAIADQIYARRGHVKIVFIAGPSSSGKTSSSLRIALQCRVLGLNPKVLELDNYFVDREHTPKDENGDYDFESLHAMDLKLLNEQLNDLLAGKEVEIPRYDFKTGSRVFEGNMMKLGEKDILIMEGIHALNPEMVSGVDNSKIFRVYASALTSLNLDENNNISTSDNRLLRRMVRDNRTRGIVPEETILRWHSVRRGESRNIFPFQENADAEFNSALIFELPMLKYYAEPLLRRIQPSSPAYTTAVRLLKFLGYVTALQPSEIEAIPPTSIMREFIGGQTLNL